jgi:hypothetical protein
LHFIRKEHGSKLLVVHIAIAILIDPFEYLEQVLNKIKEGSLVSRIKLVRLPAKSFFFVLTYALLHDDAGLLH